MTRIDAELLQYHRRLVEEVGRVRLLSDHWAAYLAARYELGQHDSIDAEGVIHRAAAPVVPTNDQQEASS